jgi:hypothetical protein
MTKRKTKRRTTKRRNSFTETNKLIGNTTKAVIGLGVLCATANIASELLKK